MNSMTSASTISNEVSSISAFEAVIDTNNIHSLENPVDGVTNLTVTLSRAERSELRRLNKKKKRVMKYKLLPPCQCRNGRAILMIKKGQERSSNYIKTAPCLNSIPENRREELHRQFWVLSYDARRAWIYQQIKLTASKHPGKENTGIKIRVNSRKYFLPGENGVNFEVCKRFFLHTLGHKSDKIISTLYKNKATTSITPALDQRGKRSPVNKLSVHDREIMRAHVESYKPCVSHYRREHAPNRRYMSSDITIRSMFADFKCDHLGIKCCYETYRAMISSMNISFTKLGEEQCEVCLFHKRNNENHRHDEVDTTCTICEKYSNHINSAAIARRHYQADRNNIPPTTTMIVSTDMQKVIMLPRIPGIKSCVFTRRVVAFHQTFAPLGKLFTFKLPH